MNVVHYFKKELSSYTKLEKIFFPLVIIFITILSFVSNDNKIALISAICGISYVVFLGKGKVYGYYIGLVGTVCYSYLSYKNGFFGNLVLYAVYYFSMQVLGIFTWKKNLKKGKNEIIKTKLSNKERLIFFAGAIVLSFLIGIILKLTGGNNYAIDGITTACSIFGQILTVKRCLEQWYFWLIVNLFSTIMWIIAYINGSNCLATVCMWTVYLVLTFYFIKTWKKEVES